MPHIMVIMDFIINLRTSIYSLDVMGNKSTLAKVQYIASNLFMPSVYPQIHRFNFEYNVMNIWFILIKT